MSDTSFQRMTRNHRQIIRRIIVQGILVLRTPTCLGSGDSESSTDLSLIRDSISPNALLTGASIAGALRNYLREYERGYESAESRSDLATLLFGGMRQDDDGEQSPLVVYDSISTKPPIIELRDGVKINSQTGTAEDNAKYDLELLAAGTQFPIQFELFIDNSVVKSQEKVDQLLAGLAIALQGLEMGDISLGMKKRRGFGRCGVKQWAVYDYDMTDSKQLLDWLSHDHWTSLAAKATSKADAETNLSIVELLKVNLTDTIDQRDRLKIKATFELASPMLIRSGELEAKAAPDTVHLKSYRNGRPVPIISGPSLAGVLRHRAERIVNTLGKSTGLIDTLFGFVEETAEREAALASRLVVHESEITMPSNQPETTKPQELVQTRIAIDRFTGGAYSGALFQEQPVFDSGRPQADIELELRSPKPYEVGLLLLLIKDLWTEDLPVGGTSSIGRGRLKGTQATIDLQGNEPSSWKIEQLAQGLKVSNLLELEKSEQSVKQSLEVYVQALNNDIEEKEVV